MCVRLLHVINECLRSKSMWFRIFSLKKDFFFYHSFGGFFFSFIKLIQLTFSVIVHLYMNNKTKTVM